MTAQKPHLQDRDSRISSGAASLRLSVIVPIFNEVASAREVLENITAKRIDGLEVEVIIVESNSVDGTREIVDSFASTPGVRVLYEEKAEGKGHAVRAGLGVATGDILLIQDADLEYSLDDYDKLLAPILEGRADFVLGTRHTKGDWQMRKFNTNNHIAWLFNLAHWTFTAALNLTLGTKMTDPFTMYKVFRKECLDGIELECNRFDLDWELVIKLARAGHKPVEIPVQYKSRDFKEGKKISILRDPPTWMRAWWKYSVLPHFSSRKPSNGK